MESNYAFVPAYYEWHLIEKSNPEKVLLNVVDPAEECYNEETGEAYSLEELSDMCSSWLVEEQRQAEDRGDYDRVEELESIPPRVDDVMARALYDYYIA